ncbi:cell envelope integrity protein CreD [Maricaulis sp. CAU 1757]
MLGHRTSRALGLKLLLVGAIVLLLGVPLGFVSLLSWERSERADTVSREVGALTGGEQIVRGPFIALPYRLPVTQTADRARPETRTVEYRQDHVLVSAASIETAVDQSVSLRRRGIYEVPVYGAEIRATGRFDMPDLAAHLPEGSEVDWSGAAFVVALSDLRGVARPLDVAISGRGVPLDFEPGTAFDREDWRGVRAPLSGLAPGQAIAFDMTLAINGATSLRLAASGKETQVTLASDWPHPGFFGGFLPVSRDITADGHSAHWQIPYLARGVPTVFTAQGGERFTLDSQAFGTRLVTPANDYQQVGRSLKYALFFIGFVMLMLFLIEARAAQRIHPAQYLLIGLAQVLFYLLLLALTEHTSNLLAYSASAVATVSLSGLYAMSVFDNRRLGLAVFAAMTVVYAMQYTLILIEDYALLIGSLLAFAGLGAAMALTRRIDWYDTSGQKEGAVANP